MFLDPRCRKWLTLWGSVTLDQCPIPAATLHWEMVGIYPLIHRVWQLLTVGLSQDAERQLHHAPHLPHPHQLLIYSRETDVCTES